jgi:hypothetical protein
LKQNSIRRLREAGWQHQLELPGARRAGGGSNSY